MRSDLIGQRFSRLTVVTRDGSSRQGRTWACLCDCGAVTIVATRALRSGNTTSCGCYWREQVSRRMVARNSREIVTYKGAHLRVARVNGPAGERCCVDCGHVAAEWSYNHHDPDAISDRHGLFSLNPHYYEPRCRPCHKEFDAKKTPDTRQVIPLHTREGEAA